MPGVASDPFTILGLLPKFELDMRDLERGQREAFVAKKSEGALGLEAVNEAYRLLKSPVTRAELLFARRGWSTKSSPAPILLEQVFADREAIEQARARGDTSFLSDWVGKARKRRNALGAALSQILDASEAKGCEVQATPLLEELRYLSRALTAAESALGALEEASLQP